MLFKSTHLVTISPEVVFASNVLVWVLDTFLKGRHMRPVLPMLSPEVVCVDGSENKGGNHGAVIQLVVRWPYTRFVVEKTN